MPYVMLSQVASLEEPAHSITCTSKFARKSLNAQRTLQKAIREHRSPGALQLARHDGILAASAAAAVHHLCSAPELCSLLGLSTDG